MPELGTCRKPEERAKARSLRRAGQPLKRIAAEIEVSVSTVHLWTKDIVLTPEQREYNRSGPRGPQNPEHIRKRAAAWSAKNRARRADAQEEGRERAMQGEALHASGCMLYWAEGAKARNMLKFCNSDPDMVRFFADFLHKCLGVSSDRMRLRLHVYLNNGLTLERIESHWLCLLDLPRSCLRKHSINNYPTSSSGRKRSLPYGVCTLSVARSTRELQHIYGAIQQYARFDQPTWLNGPPRTRADNGDPPKPR